MTDSSVAPSAAELFRKWKDFLDGGTLQAADAVSVAHPQLTGPLHRLIDEYLAGRATDVLGPDPEPDGPTEVPAIPGYTVLACLGRGGMGEVYRVRDRLDREFALKLARRKQLSAMGRARFLAEAYAMARLDHPHVAKVHHFDDIDGRPFFLMGLYPANLSDRWADYCASPRAAARLMAAVADGVGHLHGRGFIHRDLKPSNILIDAAGRPVVSDFGLIKGRSDADSSAGDSEANGSAETHVTGAKRSQTMAGLVLGTRRYMAPEQAAGLNHLAGPAWDVWALGVIFHELLTGQPPRSSAAPERLLSPTEPDNPPLTRLKPNLDPRLTRIVHKCLSRDPADRYPDAAAVAADLHAWLNRGRRRWIGLAAGLLVVAMVGTAVGAVVWPRDRATAPPVAATPEEALAAFQRALRDGQTADVIGPTGMPIWSELVVGETVVRPHLSDVDGTLVLDSSQMILMDLPPTGLDRYRFEVQVRQRADAKAPRFGAYAGRQRLMTKDGVPVDCFAALWFNDKAGRVLPGLRTLALRPYRRVPGSGGINGGAELELQEYTPNDGPAKDQWHTLAVDVSPERMAWYFDDQPAGTITLPLAAPWDHLFATSAGLSRGLRADPTPDGGYGLLVWQGAGSFRNARVIPPGR